MRLYVVCQHPNEIQQQQHIRLFDVSVEQNTNISVGFSPFFAPTLSFLLSLHLVHDVGTHEIRDTKHDCWF